MDRERPATLSPIVIEEVIRGRIGFDGLLMTDDIDMKALSGSAGDKAAAAIAAGCDIVLDCWARMPEMEEIAARLGEIGDRSRGRLAAAMATIAPSTEDYAAQIDKRDALLALAWSVAGARGAAAHAVDKNRGRPVTAPTLPTGPPVRALAFGK